MRPPLSGVISHGHKAQDYSWHDTMIIPLSYLICFPQVRVGDLSHHLRNHTNKQICTYTQANKIKAQKIKNTS